MTIKTTRKASKANSIPLSDIQQGKAYVIVGSDSRSWLGAVVVGTNRRYQNEDGLDLLALTLIPSAEGSPHAGTGFNASYGDSIRVRETTLNVTLEV